MRGHATRYAGAGVVLGLGDAGDADAGGSVGGLGKAGAVEAAFGEGRRRPTRTGCRSGHGRRRRPCRRRWPVRARRRRTSRRRSERGRRRRCCGCSARSRDAGRVRSWLHGRTGGGRRRGRRRPGPTGWRVLAAGRYGMGVLLEGGGQKLHRPDRARRGDHGGVSGVVGLDFADRGQHRPRQARALGRRALVEASMYGDVGDRVLARRRAVLLPPGNRLPGAEATATAPSGGRATIVQPTPAVALVNRELMRLRGWREAAAVREGSVPCRRPLVADLLVRGGARGRRGG